MDVKDLRKYICTMGEVTIPQVQNEYSLGYKEARSLFSQLEEEGAIKLKDNLTFAWCEKKKEERRTGRRPEDIMHRRINSENYEEIHQILKERAEQLRRDREDEDDEYEPHEELCLRILHDCIDYKWLTPALISEKFGLSFRRACQAIDWLKNMHYVTESMGSSGNRILISRADFNKRYSHLGFPEVKKEEVKREERTEPYGTADLITALKEISAKKSQPVSTDLPPSDSLWEDKAAFAEAVKQRTEEIVKSNMNGVKEAVNDAEIRLAAVRDTHDRAMVQLYERVVYDLKKMSPFTYFMLRRKLFTD
ncbi:MAG: hypothetical protein ACI4QI_00555 [Candidatus Coproplasma sp.]